MDGYRKGDRVRYRPRTREVCWAGDGRLLLQDTATGEWTLAAAADAALVRPADGKPPGPLASADRPEMHRMLGGDPRLRLGQAFDQGRPGQAQSADLPEEPDEVIPEPREIEVFDAEKLDVWVVATGAEAYRRHRSVVVDRTTRMIMGFELGPETHMA